MPTPPSISDVINSRFHDLLISYDFARRQRNVASGSAEGEDDYVDQDRHLLDVERSARQSRQVEEFSKEVHKQHASLELDKEVDVVFRETIKDIELVVEKVVGVNDAVPAVLDILSVRAASIGRLEPLVASQAWLAADVIKFVNLPVYRRADQSAKQKVDKLHTALSYVGLENLPFVIPSFALRQWIPHSTEPFRLMKRKLWENGLGAAICCRRLAQFHDEPEPSLFTAGMFHDLGKSAIVRLYFRAFDEVWKAKLIKARDEREKDLHDALVDLEPNPTALRNYMMEFSSSLTASIVEQFSLKRMMVFPLLEELASDLSFDDMSKGAQLVEKGIAFSRYKMLQRHNLISKDEAKAYFKAENIAIEEVLELRKLSLKRLNLRIQS